jgi:hypothetical protein
MNHAWDSMSRLMRPVFSLPRLADLAPRRKRRTTKLHMACLALCLPALAACQEHVQPQTPGERIVFSTLKLLAADGRHICVDKATAGPPLAVFRTTMRNRPAGLEPPNWYVPTPLRPPAALTSSELLRSTQADSNVHIAQPANSSSVLALADQDALNRSAWQLSGENASAAVSNINAWGIKDVAPNYWWLNRISWRCAPNYQLSNPVADQNSAFITVIADHWATIYAFNRHGTDWIPVAQWSNWIY